MPDVAVWTGTEIIVWGGLVETEERLIEVAPGVEAFPSYDLTGSGAAYTPPS